MFPLTRCCFTFSVRDGTRAILTFHLIILTVYWIYEVVTLIYYWGFKMVNYSKLLTRTESVQRHFFKTFYNLAAIFVILSAIEGINYREARPLTFYLILYACLLLYYGTVGIALGINYAVNAKSLNDFIEEYVYTSEAKGGLPKFIVILGIVYISWVYFFLVVLSHYKEMENEQNETESNQRENNHPPNEKEKNQERESSQHEDSE